MSDLPSCAGSGESRFVWAPMMKLHGSVAGNLAAAVRSVRRLRGHKVHADTLGYWDELLHHARRERPSRYPQERRVVGRLIIDLETEIAERSI